MKTIYGGIIGLVTGFVATILMTPKSGKETRNDIGSIADKSWFKTQMAYHKLAVKLGFGSRKKIADLTKERVDEANARKNGDNVDPTKRKDDKRTLEKIHSKSQATKAINSSNAKEPLKKVPAQNYKS
ncbi:MAG: YtxH domain-containing protein [Candidatus Cyclobacteriaceae bacterium M2_1C_046]